MPQLHVALFPKHEAPVLACLCVMLAVAMGVPISWRKLQLADSLRWIGWDICLGGKPVAALPEDKRAVLLAALWPLLRPSRSGGGAYAPPRPRDLGASEDPPPLQAFPIRIKKCRAHFAVLCTYCGMFRRHGRRLRLCCGGKLECAGKGACAPSQEYIFCSQKFKSDPPPMPSASACVGVEGWVVCVGVGGANGRRIRRTLKPKTVEA